ncbi:MAG: DNA mismatch repair endonuclease MutL [Oligoflexus sp.]
MTKKVQLLEDALINKIAAGEVVERPASVLKELVENAMDAGATRIEIALEEGGRRRITVRDNGSGMSPEDALMAMLRHTTSKIHSVHDLFQINTMGFRGEALASISSVSRFCLQTLAQGEKEGTRIELSDGKQRQTPWTGPSGTQITVEDLFYNVPARQAFLRSAATEYACCAEYIQALALARPNIELLLTHNGRETLRAIRRCEDQPLIFGEQILRQRFQDVFPKESVEQLIYCHARDKFGSFEAVLSPPGYERPQSKFMHSFVNGRWVKDKTLRYGIMRGYHSHLLKGKYPVCALYVTIDPSLIDVNVHPAKTEVRFQYGGELQSLIALEIRNRLRQGAWSQPDTKDQPEAKMAQTQPLVKNPVELPPPDFDLSFSHSASGPRDDFRPVARSVPSSGSFAKPKSTSSEIKRTVISFDGPTLADAEPAVKPLMPAAEGAYQIPWSQLQYLGCFGKCYLMFEVDEQLLVVDQHAFHERILFEKLHQDHSILQQVQPLLVPEVIDLDPLAVSRLKEYESTYQSLGFHLGFPSDHEVEILALPSLLAKRDPEVLLHELLDAEDQTKPDRDLTPRVAHDLLATMACHAAVRAGERLDEEDIQRLIAEAEDIDFYHNCPHGRRVFKWWKKSQVEAWFDR